MVNIVSIVDKDIVWVIGSVRLERENDSITKSVHLPIHNTLFIEGRMFATGDILLLLICQKLLKFSNSLLSRVTFTTTTTSTATTVRFGIRYTGKSEINSNLLFKF